jgi:dipeptidyl aminopeptidase/acylaminoacyl peptidase
MRILSIVFFCCLLFSVPANAADTKSPSPFLTATNCFSTWPSYDAWLAQIRAKNSWWNPKVLMLPWIFPRKDFDRALTQLDCKFVTYESDGLTIYGWMVMPKGDKAHRLPVLIYNRGGNASFGAVDFATVMDTLFPYAEEGFLVLASQYRGVNETEPKRLGTDQFGGADVRDVSRLVDMVAQIPRADPDNIFMLGVSRGAMMSFMTARRTNRIKAMAVIGDVSDLKTELRNRPEMEQVYVALIPGYAAHKDQSLADRSVLGWAQDLPPHMPLLILHGQNDERVHVSNAINLHRRLDQLGRPNKLIVYPGDDHFLSKHRDQSRAEIVHWFRAAMSARRPPVGAVMTATSR